jgi:hypothetical protein
MSTIDLKGMRGLGLDEALLQRLASELEKGGSTGGGGGLLGLALSRVDFAKLSNDHRHQSNLKDIRSRVFFKILDEAAIAAGKNYHAKTFNLARVGRRSQSEIWRLPTTMRSSSRACKRR